MFDITAVASALVCAREHCLPGKEAVAVSDLLWHLRRSSLPPSCRSRTMVRPRKTNVIPLAESRHEFRQIEVETSLITAFRKEAIARGTNADRLIRDLLSVIVADHLTTAILDDQPVPD
jgi:hypothetical protein